MSTTTTKSGRMTTDRPERYARQLVSHWSKRGPVSDEDGTIVQRWEDGRVIRLTPAEGFLEVEVSVPDDGDVDRFAAVVADHLARFGRRDELSVDWT